MHDHSSAEAVPQGDVPSALFGHDWAKDAFELDIVPNRTGSNLRASNSLDGSSPVSAWRSVSEATPGRSCGVSPGFDELGHSFPDEVASSSETIVHTNRTNSAHVGAQGLTSETDILRNVRVAENSKRLVEGVPLALRMRGGKRLSTQAAALESCSTFLRFREFAESRPRLMAANFCKLHRLCPWCARRRALKLMGEQVAKTLKVMEEKQGEWLPCMVTLTVKNGEDLRERIGHLSKSLGKAHQRRRHASGRGRWSEFARIEAAVWHIEVSKGKGGWHPHVHGLVMRKTAERFDVDALREEWKEITGDSMFLRVDLLHSVKESLSVSVGWWKLMQTPEFKGRLVKDLCEVFKYPLKFAGLSAEDIVEVAEQSRGVRWLREWGTTFRASEPDVLSDDAVAGQLWRDHVYKWVVESLRYECSRVSEWQEPE